jgi:PPP family 3-phenylpropionic acid transporter
VHIPFLLAIAIAALLQSSHMLIYGFGTLHWQGLGYSSLLIGALWAIGVIAEIGLFAFSGAVVAAVGAWPLLLVAALAAVLRWTAMAFDPPLGLLIALQTLHGLTFGATHLAIVNLVADAVPAELGATAQSVMYAMASLAGSLAMLAAGALYAAFGTGAFWAMAGLALGGLALAVGGLLLQARGRRSA